MSHPKFNHIRSVFIPGLLLCVWVMASCSSTKHIKEGQYLLRKTSLKLSLDQSIGKKAETRDNLNRIIAQKPNTYTFGRFPIKLWLYNARYKRYQRDTFNFQLKSKTVEKPVILDTSLVRKTLQDMKSHMFNQGYFYAKVSDSIRLSRKKAYVQYSVDAGTNFLINKVTYDANNSDAMYFLSNSYRESKLQKNAEFSMSMLEEERSRITALLRDNGFYKFTQDNITNIEVDTFNKAYFRDIESPFESAVNFISQQKDDVKKPTLDLTIYIRPTDDSSVYTRYSIGRVLVLPDFAGVDDIRDTTMIEKQYGNYTIKYHDYYVRSNVVLKHIYLEPGKLYSQSDYDRTITKLNDLGIFQYIRIYFREDTTDPNVLNCVIALNRTQKHDFSTSFEVSNGTTYTLGNTLNLSYRDRNLMKGANLLTMTLSGGIELVYNEKVADEFFDKFFLLTRNYGLNASIDFPKFLAPIASRQFTNSNLPHTIISAGTNMIQRVNYFTLVNTSAGFKYNWQETQTKTWDLSPAFINVIRLPYISDSFRQRLATNDFLRASYQENFIEGENLTFTFSDFVKKKGRNYSFLKLGVEEAGAVLTSINSLGTVLNELYDLQYAQYMKFDFDARHYFTLPHASLAFRFLGGVGVPYGLSDALPYIKQYFVGGPYSLRGWRIRSLGPGSYYDPNIDRSINYIDRTGDIKLEMNGEYRFLIAQMFAGSVLLNGALFADAGNIWLMRKSADYPMGEFNFNTLGQTIAADMGFGARFDIASFLTLRFDFAFPVKKPYVFTNSGWVFNELAPFDRSWRANNLIFNIAVGYPF